MFINDFIIVFVSLLHLGISSKTLSVKEYSPTMGWLHIILIIFALFHVFANYNLYTGSFCLILCIIVVRSLITIIVLSNDIKLQKKILDYCEQCIILIFLFWFLGYIILWETDLLTNWLHAYPNFLILINFCIITTIISLFIYFYLKWIK